MRNSRMKARNWWWSCSARNANSGLLRRAGRQNGSIAAKQSRGEVLACDIHPTRLATMRRRLTLERDRTRIEYRVADAATLTGVGPFDRILCDVPCTGTGTLARNPEIRDRLRPEELTRQGERQRDILSVAMRLLAPGGRLLYSTCSLEPEENEAVVEACLNSAENSTRRWNRLICARNLIDCRERGLSEAKRSKICAPAGFMMDTCEPYPDFILATDSLPR